MSLKKSVSSLMVVIQLGWALPVSAATPATHSAEYNLLRHVLAFQGQDLTDEQNQKRVSDVVNQYLAATPEAGQQQRFQNALVDLGVYTESEAADFVAESQQAGLKIAASNSVGSTMESEITQLANLHPMGAQFSSCAMVTAGVVMMVFGSAGFLVSLAGPHYSNDASCGAIPCSQQDYYHSDSERNANMIGTGVLAAVGAILYIAGGSCS